jgi:hypothetical protein
MTFTLTSDSYNVTLREPSKLISYTGKNISIYKFQDGTNGILDKGKRVFQITMDGTEYNDTQSTTHTNMNKLNQIMNAQEPVILTGLSDTNLNNKEYYIVGVSFKRPIGEPNTYYWSITLERLHEDV